MHGTTSALISTKNSIHNFSSYLALNFNVTDFWHYYDPNCDFSNIDDIRTIFTSDKSVHDDFVNLFVTYTSSSLPTQQIHHKISLKLLLGSIQLPFVFGTQFSRNTSNFTSVFHLLIIKSTFLLMRIIPTSSSSRPLLLKLTLPALFPCCHG